MEFHPENLRVSQVLVYLYLASTNIVIDSFGLIEFFASARLKGLRTESRIKEDLAVGRYFAGLGIAFTTCLTSTFLSLDAIHETASALLMLVVAGIAVLVGYWLLAVAATLSPLKENEIYSKLFRLRQRKVMPAIGAVANLCFLLLYVLSCLTFHPSNTTKASSEVIKTSRSSE